MFSNSAKADDGKTAYDFSFTEITGEELPLDRFKDKVVMVVNTASHCGFTGQYENMQNLHAEYKDKGFEIIAVPSGDFGGQEFDSNAEIKEFCEMKFAPTFTLTEKETVSGDDAHPFYQHAGDKLGFGTKPKWNFHKYLVNKQGEVVDYYNSNTSPDADKVKKRIDGLLAE